MGLTVHVQRLKSVSTLSVLKENWRRCEMGYVNDEKRPELVYVGADVDEIVKISKQVERLNADLIDSGFDQYRYGVRCEQDRIYIERV